MAPLTSLTRSENSNIAAQWSPECQKAFEEIKQRVTSAPILAPPRFGKTFFLDTDASKVAVGACLLQEGSDGLLHPIAFASRKLNKHEQNYPSVESEALAITFALHQFRAYIEACEKCIVRTDNSALCSLLRRKDLTGRLAKYQIAIQAFPLEIIHRSGASNRVADFLSRHTGDDAPLAASADAAPRSAGNALEPLAPSHQVS
ncbi:hypothetical protein AAVH_20366 [Aphelenchoides avenae]|nr:hypothetical protein AAVH_20366 [Aphelenchus avenae]